MAFEPHLHGCILISWKCIALNEFSNGLKDYYVSFKLSCKRKAKGNAGPFRNAYGDKEK